MYIFTAPFCPVTRHFRPGLEVGYKINTNFVSDFLYPENYKIIATGSTFEVVLPSKDLLFLKIFVTYN
jgi:hypothetical protein